MRLMVKKPDAGKKKVPCVLWIHGGGYALGMPEMQMMSQAKNLAGECVIVSPDYRLSVDAPYPAALDDCYLALVWLKNHGAELGGNTDQIFVGGESAGGGLTVATCLYARDQGDVKIAYVKRLKEDGVPVAFKVYKGCFHAFDMMAPWTKEAKEASTFFIKSFEYAKENFFAKQFP